jgi:hypothetical protein
MNLNYSFVAFLDILGFSEMVKRDCHSGGLPPTFLPLLSDALSQTRKLNVAEGIRLVQFSDSIVLSLPYQRNRDTFCGFLKTISSLQHMLFERQILCRGGVAHGKHSESDEIYFSQALVEAYRIESQLAQNPRIVVSFDLLELFEPAGLPLITDKDGLTFVDFLRDVKPEDLSNLLKTLEVRLEKPSPSVASKARWIADYCSNKVPGLNSGFQRALITH